MNDGRCDELSISFKWWKKHKWLAQFYTQEVQLKTRFACKPWMSNTNGEESQQQEQINCVLIRFNRMKWIWIPFLRQIKTIYAKLDQFKSCHFYFILFLHERLKPIYFAYIRIEWDKYTCSWSVYLRLNCYLFTRWRWIRECKYK